WLSLLTVRLVYHHPGQTCLDHSVIYLLVRDYKIILGTVLVSVSILHISMNFKYCQVNIFFNNLLIQII
ncbi:hypothetical protein L9F63_010243, partial [Diploptera punctata]